MKNGEQSTYPVIATENTMLDLSQTGLTKREYFAGLAMQGLISKYTLKTPEDQITITKLSIEIAGELLKQLEHK